MLTIYYLADTHTLTKNFIYHYYDMSSATVKTTTSIKHQSPKINVNSTGFLTWLKEKYIKLSTGEKLTTFLTILLFVLGSIIVPVLLEKGSDDVTLVNPICVCKDGDSISGIPLTYLQGCKTDGQNNCRSCYPTAIEEITKEGMLCKFPIEEADISTTTSSQTTKIIASENTAPNSDPTTTTEAIANTTTNSPMSFTSKSSMTESSVSQRLFYTQQRIGLNKEIYSYVIDDVDGPQLKGKFQMPIPPPWSNLPGLTFNYDLKKFRIL